MSAGEIKKRPLRSSYQELIDVSWGWEKREEVEQAYLGFWETLPESDKKELSQMLV